MGSKLEELPGAASTIIRQHEREDEFALMQFKASPALLQDFTTDAALLTALSTASKLAVKPHCLTL